LVATRLCEWGALTEQRGRKVVLDRQENERGKNRMCKKVEEGDLKIIPDLNTLMVF
jgi:hypothetical protein